MRPFNALLLSIMLGAGATLGSPVRAADAPRIVQLGVGLTEAYIPLVGEDDSVKVEYREFWCEAGGYIRDASDRIAGFLAAQARLAPESAQARELRRDAENIVTIAATNKLFLHVGLDSLPGPGLTAPPGEERTTLVRDCISRQDVERINDDLVETAKGYIKAHDEAALRVNGPTGEGVE